jgi:uncharacterized integral membrane protein
LQRIGLIVVIALAIFLGLLAGTLNHEMTAVDLLWVQVESPLGFLLLAALGTGLLIGLLLAWLFRILPLRMQLRKIRRVEASGSRYPGTTK